jgi:hypothetical protein
MTFRDRNRRIRHIRANEVLAPSSLVASNNALMGEKCLGCSIFQSKNEKCFYCNLLIHKQRKENPKEKQAVYFNSSIFLYVKMLSLP